MAKINNRKSKISSYYFDALIVGKYWGCSPEGGRVYHHTGSIHNVYALRESLRVIAEETLEKTWARYARAKLLNRPISYCVIRHAEVANLFYAGLEKLGLSVFVENMVINTTRMRLFFGELMLSQNHRLLPLTLINIPEGVDGAAVAKYMMTNYNIEVWLCCSWYFKYSAMWTDCWWSWIACWKGVACWLYGLQRVSSQTFIEGLCHLIFYLPSK